MADVSPELASRIQALEGSYADNPGRYFVALAGAWREAGDIARAEEILRENLKRFPGLSAHVLLGRCLADRGAFQEAANEFHYVLSIDSQNLIALRTLAEMAAAGGRRAEAERWYNELLAVDPMNVEARAALAQLARAGAAPEPAPAQWGDVAADAPVGGEGTDGGEFGMIDLGASDASPADASGVAADASADLGDWGDLSLDAPEEAPRPEPASASAPAADGGDFDAFGFGSVDLDASPPAEPSAEEAAPAPEWLDVDARQDVGESAAADAADLPLLDDGMIDAPLAGADLPLLDADATLDDGRLEGIGDPGAGFGFADEPAVVDGGHVVHEADGHDAEAEMVTETMAELYASQGLLAQAADVYRELIGQRGEEPGLVRRLAEIEARMHPAGAEPAPSADAADADGGTPDWLESVDAFSRGGADAAPADGGFPDLDLVPALADDVPALPSDEPAAADDFSFAEPAPSAFSAMDAAPDLAAEPVAATASADPFADSFAAGFDGAAAESAVVGSADVGSADAGSADGGSTEFGLLGVGSTTAGSADVGSAEDAGTADDRQPWEAPSVAESEPVGFDILVVADEEGAEVPAPPEVVADVSADWAIAAAPLEDDEEAAEAELAAASAAATAYVPPAPGARTMSGYFSALLAWSPGAAAAPTYEVTADASGTITIEAATPEVPAAESAAAPASVESVDAEAAPWEAGAPDASTYDAPPSILDAAPGIPTFDAPSLQPPVGAPVFGEPEGPAPSDDEPWASAAAEDEPWAAAAGESAPAQESAPAPGDLPLLDLEEPWAETPAAPAQPVDIASFTLAEDEAPAADPAPAEPTAAGGEPEELLPWEVPAEPTAQAPETTSATETASAPEAPAAGGTGGGFSFEDFFSGTTAPAETAPVPAAQPEPETLAPPAEEAPAFIPSFAEPTPPPSFAAPVTPPAPAAPPAAPAAQGQDEDDEDLESFQAWLQSLKR